MNQLAPRLAAVTIAAALLAKPIVARASTTPSGKEATVENVVAEMMPIIDEVGKVAKLASSMVPVVSFVIGAFEFLGFFQKDDPIARVEARLKTILDATLAGSTGETMRDIAEQHSKVAEAQSALDAWRNQMKMEIEDGPDQPAARGATLTALGAAVDALASEAFALRVNDPAAIVGPWQIYSSERQAVRPDGLVFDGRLALPSLLHGIAVRLAWLKAEDLDYTSNGHHRDEMLRLAARLDWYVAQLAAGVRCLEPSVMDGWSVGWPLPVGCFDVNTGAHTVEQNWWPVDSWGNLLSDPQAVRVAWWNKRFDANLAMRSKLRIESLAELADTLRDYAEPIDGYIVTGDFDGDGKSDVALVGYGERYNVPIARSRGDGSFDLLNTTPAPAGSPMRQFASWALDPAARAVAGDFDNDGDDDLALTGGEGWRNIKLALSNRDGTFTIADRTVWSTWSTDDPSFNTWARTPGSQLVVGDFNQDGQDDLALAGVAGWTTMPVALSFGLSGHFYLRNDPQPGFPEWSAQNRATLLAGNFGGWGDVFLLTGGLDWTTVPYGAPTADGTHTTSLGFHRLDNKPVDYFPERAMFSKYATGDLDGNGVEDVLAMPWWDDHVTVLLSDGVNWHTSGTWAYQQWDLGVEDWYAGSFAQWGDEPGTELLSGDFDGDGRSDLALLGAGTWTTLPVAFSRANDELNCWGTCAAGWLDVHNTPVGDFARWARKTERPRG